MYHRRENDLLFRVTSLKTVTVPFPVVESQGERDGTKNKAGTERFENLKPIKPGEVRNPQGINRKLPISERHAHRAEELLSATPVGEKLRVKMEFPGGRNMGRCVGLTLGGGSSPREPRSTRGNHGPRRRLRTAPTGTLDARQQVAADKSRVRRSNAAADNGG